MLVGLIDNKGTKYKWPDILAGKGEFDDPPALLSLFYSDDRVPLGNNEFSVTELLNDPLQLQLKRRYEYYVDIDSVQDALVGSAVHAYLASKAQDSASIVERRIEVPVEVEGKAVKISGTPDYVDVTNRVLWDYKTVTVAAISRLIADGAKAKHYRNQVFFYAWLLHNTGISVNRAIVRFWARDWRKWEAKRESKCYSKTYILKFDKIDELPKIEKHIEDRVVTHLTAQELEDENIPECDTWDGRRCAEYCSVKEFCPYRKNETK